MQNIYSWTIIPPKVIFNKCFFDINTWIEEQMSKICENYLA